MSKDKITISVPVEGEYEGHPTISIPLNSGKPFTFGIEKAAAVLKWLDAVKAFAAKNPAKGGKVAPATMENLEALAKQQGKTVDELLAELLEAKG